MSDTFIEGQFSDAEDDDTMLPEPKVEKIDIQKVENEMSHNHFGNNNDHGFFTESDDDDEMQKVNHDHRNCNCPGPELDDEIEKKDGDSHYDSEYGASFPSLSSSILLKKEEKSTNYLAVVDPMLMSAN